MPFSFSQHNTSPYMRKSSATSHHLALSYHQEAQEPQAVA